HPQRIARKRSTPGPELGVNGIRWRVCALPAIGERPTDDLPEHLADLGPGGEIARRAQGVARRIIIAVAGFHIGFDGYRPLGLDTVAKRELERRHETLAVPTVDSTRTRRRLAVSIRYSPPRIIGSDSHW